MAILERKDVHIGDLDRQERRRTIRRKNQMNSLVFVVACIAAFAVLLAGAIALYMWVNKEDQASHEAVNLENQQVSETVRMYTQEEMEAHAALLAEAEKQKLLDQLAEELNSGNTMVQTLRSLYDDHIVVASSGKYHFVPITDAYKKHNYRTENIVISGKELSYVENGQQISHKGIDVSKYNGTIDWSKVAADGVEFAFIRVGIRGYGAEGRLVADEGFEINIENALKNGIKVGVYFFTQATTEDEAREEAAFVADLIAPYKIQCPVVVDVEKIDDSEARMNKISAEERTKMVKIFCQEIEKAGYHSMIYFNMEMAAVMLDLAQLEEYDKWFAYYNKDIYYPYEFKVWQYSDKGTVDGIDGQVDMNISFGEIWK